MTEIEQTAKPEQKENPDKTECKDGCACQTKRGTHSAQMRQLNEMLYYAIKASTHRMDVLEIIAEKAAQYISLVVIKNESEADNFSEEDAEKLSKALMGLIESLRELAKINLPDFLCPHIVNTRAFKDAAAAFEITFKKITDLANSGSGDPKLAAEIEEAKKEAIKELVKECGLTNTEQDEPKE